MKFLEQIKLQSSKLIQELRDFHTNKLHRKKDELLESIELKLHFLKQYELDEIDIEMLDDFDETLTIVCESHPDWFKNN